LSNPARSFDPKSLSAGLIAAPDSACTLVGLFNAVSYGAKTIRSLQLARYAMVFLNSASAAKAGEITPEVATYIGDILTKTVTETLPDGTTETTKAATDS